MLRQSLFYLHDLSPCTFAVCLCINSAAVRQISSVFVIYSDKHSFNLFKVYILCVISISAGRMQCLQWYFCTYDYIASLFFDGKLFYMKINLNYVTIFHCFLLQFFIILVLLYHKSVSTGFWVKHSIYSGG